MLDKRVVIAEFCKYAEIPEDWYNDAYDIFVTEAIGTVNAMTAPGADKSNPILAYLAAAIADQSLQNKAGDQKKIERANTLVVSYTTLCRFSGLIK